MINDEEQMVITKVEQQKRHKQRYNIFVNHEFAFAVHQDIVVKYRLLKDSTLTKTFIQNVISEEERHSAFRSALHYIGRAMRSEKEVAHKLLTKGYEGDTIAIVLNMLKQQQLIDDNVYASTLALQRLRMNKKGPLWIQRELIQKGISKEHIRSALNQCDENAVFEQALALAAKRWEQDTGDDLVKLRKVTQLLQRRGYSTEVIRMAIYKLNNKLNDYIEE
jgi:regulatory protein